MHVSKCFAMALAFVPALCAQVAPQVPANPVFFEPNQGQAPAGFPFVGRWGSQTVLLAPQGATVLLTGPRTAPTAAPDPAAASAEARAVHIDFEGAAPESVMEAGSEARGETRYFLGAERFTASRYQTVRAREVYPGIDVLFYGHGGNLEHDFVVAPGADPAAIRLRFSGVDSLTLDAGGNLVAVAGPVQLMERKPALYQETPGGRRTIDGAFRLLGDGLAGFAVGDYDRTRPLIIDPVVARGVGYLGGSANDGLQNLAIDADGNIIATGYTASADFLGNTLVRAGGPPKFDTFVTKFDASLENVLWSVILGGAGDDVPNIVTTNSLGQVFVAGSTTSSDFPTKNPIQPVFGGATDMFVLGLPADGSQLLFSSYLGGAQFDSAYGATADPQNNFYFCGLALSGGLPTTPGVIQPQFKASYDIVFGSLSNTGQGRALSYLGGTGADYCSALQYQEGDLYFAGQTYSGDIPITDNSMQAGLRGDADLLLGRVNAALTKLDYLSLFGGEGTEYPFGLLVNPLHQVVLTGMTTSHQFPAATGFPVTHHGATSDDSDGFYALFNFDDLLTPAPTLIQSGLVGGKGNDTIYSALPMTSPGGGYYGLILYGGSQSAFPSTLPGTRDCSPPASGFNLAMFEAPLGTSDVFGGCFTPGLFLSAKRSSGRQIVGAIVDGPVPLPPSNLFDPLFHGGVDGAILVFDDTFHDPDRLNGAFGIEQTSFNYGPNARQANSTTGSLWIDLQKIAEQYDRGYFNLYIDGVGWVGQNLRFDILSGVDFPSTDILLPATPGPINTLNMRFGVTESGLTEFPSNVPPVQIGVTPRIEDTHCFGGIGAIPPPPAKDHTYTVQGETWEHLLTGSSINVQTAQDQCGPMAMANSLAWLSTQHADFVVPNAHVPGLKGDNSLVGKLDTAMDRDVTSRSEGAGVYERVELMGKFAYLKDNNLNGMMEHKYQGPIRDGFGFGHTSDYSSSGSTAKNEGEHVTFDWICDQIKRNEDVEVVYEWDGGAHVVRVFGCGMIHGAPYLWTLDDAAQTDGDPADSMGLRTRRIFVSNLGTDDLHWDNLSKTVRTAISESLLPEVKQKPGSSPITWRDAIAQGASFAVDLFTKGSVGTAFGYFASATSGSKDARAALANSIDGTQVLLNGAPIPLYLVSPGQINFQIPTDFPLGQATLQVKQGDRIGAAVTIDVQTTAPGIFLIGENRGAIQNQDFSLHTPQNPAKAGEALVVYMTGLGEKDTLVPSGVESPQALVRAVADVTATIGGKNAPVAFAGLTPGFVGLEQVNLTIPDLPPGEYPLVITAGGVESNSVLVNVAE